MKTLIIILFILFFSPFCCASTISISPANLEFIGKINEQICKEMVIKSDSANDIVLTDLWAEKEVTENFLYLHNKNSEELELYLTYPKEIKIDLIETINICITGKDSGIYHGALLSRIKDKPVQIGIWLNVTLEKDEKIALNEQKIKENNLIEKNKFPKNATFLFFILGTIFIGLFIIEKKLKA